MVFSRINITGRHEQCRQLAERRRRFARQSRSNLLKYDNRLDNHGIHCTSPHACIAAQLVAGLAGVQLGSFAPQVPPPPTLHAVPSHSAAGHRSPHVPAPAHGDHTTDCASKISEHSQVSEARPPCKYFMEGRCARTDCFFSHDLQAVPCRLLLCAEMMPFRKCMQIL